jgi:hypothetical protein
MIDLTLWWSAMRWLMALLVMAAAMWAIKAALQRREARRTRAKGEPLRCRPINHF